MKGIYDEKGMPEGIDWELEGPINVGEIFVWAPLVPEERSELEVVKVMLGEECVQWITTRRKYDGTITHTSESSFRESCVRVPAGNKKVKVCVENTSVRSIEYTDGVKRLEDMSPDGYIKLMRQTDGDVILEVFGDNIASRKQLVHVEFCTSGGQSHNTLMALVQLIEAIKKDNAERDQHR